ncbi:MAG: hypothetical protein HKP58_13645 [Desulfatitalea sp.]|nr:hypothetical protein [Desulfatitalea sp.]NNK01445.1 hypothetical protein [Desulfatitalea sp.]
MGRWIINCEEYAQMASRGMDCPISLSDRLLILIHQWICPPCKFIRHQLDDIRTACRWTPSEGDATSYQQEPLPEEIRSRIKSAMKAQSKSVE